MARVLAVACDIKRLSEVNNFLRARGHMVRGADCRSTMRHLLSAEPFQCIVVLETLPASFADALREELRAGRRSPRVVWADGVEVNEIDELITGLGTRKARAA
jgi:hypothetical protein